MVLQKLMKHPTVVGERSFSAKDTLRHSQRCVRAIVCLVKEDWLSVEAFLYGYCERFQIMEFEERLSAVSQKFSEKSSSQLHLLGLAKKSSSQLN
jgi:hypothetical protein